MAIDRYAKLELQIRTVFRAYWAELWTTGKQRPVLLPGFDIPRGETVDLFLHPKEGTALVLVQRSDYLTVYKHTVGQLVGTLAHYQQMTDRQLRETVRVCREHADLMEEQKQPSFNILRTAERLLIERDKGLVTLVLVADLPEVAQQSRELHANLKPVLQLLQPWMVSPVKKKKYCQSVELLAVDLRADPASVRPMLEALQAAEDVSP